MTVAEGATVTESLRQTIATRRADGQSGGWSVRHGSRSRGHRVERKPVVIAHRHLVVHRSTAATQSSVIPEAAAIASWRAVTSRPRHIRLYR